MAAFILKVEPNGFAGEWGTSQVALVVENPPADAGDMRCGFDPWVRKISWRRSWKPTPVFLPGESHGQRSLVDYNSWGRKESDMAEHAENQTTVGTYYKLAQGAQLGALL